MRHFVLLCYCLLWGASVNYARAEENPVTIAWKNPTENIDGTPVEGLSKITFYSNGALLQEILYTSGPLTTYDFTLPCGENTIYATVTDVDGDTSANSNSVIKTVDCPPAITIPNPPIITNRSFDWAFPITSFTGVVDDIKIVNNPVFQSAQGRFEVTFTANALAGALFSRDQGGQAEAGHLTMSVNNLGQVTIRHQSANPDYSLPGEQTNMNLAGGSVVVGQEHIAIYSFGPQGASLEVDGVVVATNPAWTIGIDGNTLPMGIGASLAVTDASNPTNYRNPFNGNLYIEFYRTQ